jgi:hypothetical protein
LLDLAFVPEDAIGPLIIMESRHLDRETVEGQRPSGGRRMTPGTATHAIKKPA